MKQIILTFLMLAVLFACGRNKPLPSSRLQQPAGQFSYITPDGWFRVKLSGLDFVVVSTDADFGVKPNIYVDYIEHPSTLEKAVANVMKVNQENHKSYQIDKQDDFMTEAGLAGVKISAVRKNDAALPLAIFHYLIEESGRVIVITCTCADSVKKKYEGLFDVAMKSLKAER
jgi:hypothetical protein